MYAGYSAADIALWLQGLAAIEKIRIVVVGGPEDSDADCSNWVEASGIIDFKPRLSYIRHGSRFEYFGVRYGIVGTSTAVPPHYFETATSDHIPGDVHKQLTELGHVDALVTHLPPKQIIEDDYAAYDPDNTQAQEGTTFAAQQMEQLLKATTPRIHVFSSRQRMSLPGIAKGEGLTPEGSLILWNSLTGKVEDLEVKMPD